MPGMPEFTHRHDMIQKSTSLSTKDMQQWHSHQGCEPTYFNTPSISWDHMSYVVSISHICYLFNVCSMWTIQFFTCGDLYPCICAYCAYNISRCICSHWLCASVDSDFCPEPGRHVSCDKNTAGKQNSTEFRIKFKQCDCTVFTSSLLLIFVLHVYEILRT